VTRAEIIYQRRIAVLDYAVRVGNVAEACRVFGISRTRYYECTVQAQASKPEYHDTLSQAATLAQQLDDTDILIQAALGFPLQEAVGDDAAKPVHGGAAGGTTRR
jgi:hypothetical protein